MCNSDVNFLIGIQRSLHHCSQHLKVIGYKHLISPILECQISILDPVHNNLVYEMEIVCRYVHPNLIMMYGKTKLQINFGTIVKLQQSNTMQPY